MRAECPICKGPSTDGELREAGWLDREVLDRIARWSPQWKYDEGACPACLQHALLECLAERGDADLHDSIQRVWPIDAEAAYGAIPTPLRMHADPHASGRGTTLAIVDSAFYPHPDFTQPFNRIRAWVDASSPTVNSIRFSCDDVPKWPGWDECSPQQWHGLMTSAVAAGNGSLSRGLYRGIAADAQLILLQVRDPDGRITNESICRALHWLQANHSEFGTRVVNLSVAGDPETGTNPIDNAIRDLVAAGLVVTAAAGNDGIRSLVPPAASPDSITVGGLDDQNSFEHAAMQLWHSNYEGHKPELVAPSMWVVAPILPGTNSADLFELRRFGDENAEREIRQRKLVRPEYQLVDGTSFAAPIVASIVCAMFEVNPLLTPAAVRMILTAAATRIEGASGERQGAGAIDAGHAVNLARHWENPRLMVFRLADGAESVTVHSDWNDWRLPGIAARQVCPNIWAIQQPALPSGVYRYKLLLNGMRWVHDANNLDSAPDGFGGLNSVLTIKDS